MQQGEVAETLGAPPARVLAVDDTAANLTALRALLEPMGYEVVTADSGREALARAAEAELAVVLLDVMMPEMDGFETLERLRELPRFDDTPVVLLTAYEPEPRMFDRAYALGATDYLRKPIAPGILRAKVRVFVSLYRRGWELRRRGEALAAKDRYISILAHDLRAPLTTIEILAESMARRELSPRHREQAGKVLKAARRMEAMTTDLLDFARLGTGRLPIKRAEMDLSVAVREVVEEVGLAHPERPIDLEVTGCLPGRWDRGRLLQVLANLVVNAIKYGEGAVAVRAQRRTAAVELTVWNTGEPIPETRIAQIFEPFERGHEGGAGLGLGLYVVREIVRAHGGTVDVTSSRERGTTFTVSLPVEPEWTSIATEAHP